MRKVHDASMPIAVVLLLALIIPLRGQSPSADLAKEDSVLVKDEAMTKLDESKTSQEKAALQQTSAVLKQGDQAFSNFDNADLNFQNTLVPGAPVWGVEGRIKADEQALEVGQKQLEYEEKVLDQEEKLQASQEKQLDQEQKTLDAGVKALIKSPNAGWSPVTSADLVREDKTLRQERVNTRLDETKTLQDKASLAQTKNTFKQVRQDIAAASKAEKRFEKDPSADPRISNQLRAEATALANEEALEENEEAALEKEEVEQEVEEKDLEGEEARSDVAVKRLISDVNAITSGQAPKPRGPFAAAGDLWNKMVQGLSPKTTSITTTIVTTTTTTTTTVVAQQSSSSASMPSSSGSNQGFVLALIVAASCVFGGVTACAMNCKPARKKRKRNVIEAKDAETATAAETDRLLAPSSVDNGVSLMPLPVPYTKGGPGPARKGTPLSATAPPLSNVRMLQAEVGPRVTSYQVAEGALPAFVPVVRSLPMTTSYMPQAMATSVAMSAQGMPMSMPISPQSFPVSLSLRTPGASFAPQTAEVGFPISSSPQTQGASLAPQVVEVETPPAASLNPSLQGAPVDHYTEFVQAANSLQAPAEPSLDAPAI